MANEDGVHHRRNTKPDPVQSPCGLETGYSQDQSGTVPMTMWSQSTNFQGNAADPNQGSRHVNPDPNEASQRTAHEYALAVQQWLWQCQMCNTMNWFYVTLPFYTMSMTACMSAQQAQQQQPQMSNGIGPAGAFGSRAVVAPPLGAGAGRAAGVGAAGRPGAGAQANAAGQLLQIPPVWKRVTAEFVDFFVLFLIKLAVTILTVEYVGIVDVHKYNIDVLLNQNIDYNTAFAMTSELIAMEIINRVFICIFETLCLRRGVGGAVGGTTPGKRIMGLRVVSCEQIVDVPGTNFVRIQPAGDIGFWNALVRSVIKNFSLAFFFPVCFTVFFLQNNRAAYDIISNCIVVEDAS